MHSKGDYTVSSAYKGLNQEGSLLSYLHWKLIWKQRYHTKWHVSLGWFWGKLFLLMIILDIGDFNFVQDVIYVEKMQRYLAICFCTAKWPATYGICFINLRGIRWEMPRITFEILTRWSTESKCSTNKDRWKIVSATIWWSKRKERNSRCFGNTSNPLQRIKNELYPSVLLLGYKSEHIDDPVLIIEILCFLLEELGVGLLFLLLSGSSDVKHSFFVWWFIYRFCYLLRKKILLV